MRRHTSGDPRPLHPPLAIRSVRTVGKRARRASIRAVASRPCSSEVCNVYTLLRGWQLGTPARWRSRGVWGTLSSFIDEAVVFVQPVTWWICRPGSPTTMAITSGTSGSSSCNRVRPAIMMTTGIGRSRTLC